MTKPSRDVRAAKKAFSSKRGLFFAVKGVCALPKFHTDPRPSPQKGVIENPSGGLLRGGGGGRGWWGGGGVRVEFGKRATPLYREKKAPFR